jgi:hypothetical protein
VIPSVLQVICLRHRGGNMAAAKKKTATARKAPARKTAKATARRTAAKRKR